MSNWRWQWRGSATDVTLWVGGVWLVLGIAAYFLIGALSDWKAIGLALSVWLGPIILLACGWGVALGGRWLWEHPPVRRVDEAVPAASSSWPAAYWEYELRDLYASTDMDTEEFERLLSVALTGERPEHMLLPAYAPFPAEATR